VLWIRIHHLWIWIKQMLNWLRGSLRFGFCPPETDQMNPSQPLNYTVTEVYSDSLSVYTYP
jgi:hypothetical protein